MNAKKMPDLFFIFGSPKGSLFIPTWIPPNQSWPNKIKWPYLHFFTSIGPDPTKQ